MEKMLADSDELERYRGKPKEILVIDQNFGEQRLQILQAKFCVAAK